MSKPTALNITQAAAGKPGQTETPDGSIPVYNADNDQWEVGDLSDAAGEVGGGGGSHSVLANSTAEVTVVNTTSETDLLRYTVTGGSLAAGDLLRLTTFGYFMNNSEPDVYPLLTTIRAKFGASEVFEYADAGNILFVWPAGETQPWRLSLDVVVQAAAVQRASGLWTHGVTGTTDGTAGFSSDTNASRDGGRIIAETAIAENTASDKDLAVTFEVDTAHADISCVRQYYMLEKITP